MNQALLQAKLTGRAARFVRLLQEFDHLDARTTEAFLIALADFCGAEQEATVDIDQVRQLAASWLFAEHDEMIKVLSDDWNLLFS